MRKQFKLTDGKGLHWRPFSERYVSDDNIVIFRIYSLPPGTRMPIGPYSQTLIQIKWLIVITKFPMIWTGEFKSELFPCSYLELIDFVAKRVVTNERWNGTEITRRRSIEFPKKKTKTKQNKTKSNIILSVVQVWRHRRHHAFLYAGAEAVGGGEEASRASNVFGQRRSPSFDRFVLLWTHPMPRGAVHLDKGSPKRDPRSQQ